MIATLPVLAALLATTEPAPLAHPLNGEGRATSGFGMRADPFTGKKGFHAGLDFAAALGTPVHSAKAGKVESVGQDGAYGLRIQIDHGDAVRTVYSQLSRIDVKQGDPIAVGQAIGAVGSTGRSTGPHLHFEVWEGEVVVDPSPLIQWQRRGPVVPD